MKAYLKLQSMPNNYTAKVITAPGTSSLRKITEEIESNPEKKLIIKHLNPNKPFNWHLSPPNINRMLEKVHKVTFPHYLTIIFCNT